mmetsp:Transcript_38522/g.89342  ORF Transcript_38522/g.89342 Transcript_38522/m.89342 type:complete len:216 (-) Transcript_38522:2576-3223(-)
MRGLIEFKLTFSAASDSNLAATALREATIQANACKTVKPDAQKGFSSVKNVMRPASAIEAADTRGSTAPCCSAEFENASARAKVRMRHACETSARAVAYSEMYNMEATRSAPTAVEATALLAKCLPKGKMASEIMGTIADKVRSLLKEPTPRRLPRNQVRGVSSSKEVSWKVTETFCRTRLVHSITVSSLPTTQEARTACTTTKDTCRVLCKNSS